MEALWCGDIRLGPGENLSPWEPFTSHQKRGPVTSPFPPEESGLGPLLALLATLRAGEQRGREDMKGAKLVQVVGATGRSTSIQSARIS